jgi:hypothetical protein
MFSSAGANVLALHTDNHKKSSDDRPRCLENPRPAGAESTLTENVASPFHAEPRHDQHVKRDVRKPTGGVIEMGPEYLGFIEYAYLVIDSVHKVIPETEKVDFLVERNGPFTTNLKHFYDGIPEFLESIGKANLIPLLGEIIPGGKDRSPLQAADVFCWHLRRDSEKSLSGVDLERWEKLVQKPKQYVLGSVRDEVLHEIAEASDQMLAKLQASDAGDGQ